MGNPSAALRSRAHIVALNASLVDVERDARRLEAILRAPYTLVRGVRLTLRDKVNRRIARLAVLGRGLGALLHARQAGAVHPS